jgi:hypothetical protein
MFQRHPHGELSPVDRNGARVPHGWQRGESSKSGCACTARSGGWADEVTELNTLIDDLVWPTTEVTRTVGAVAKGDLSQPWRST